MITLNVELQSRKLGVGLDFCPLAHLGSSIILYRPFWMNNFPYPVPTSLDIKGRCHAWALTRGLREAIFLLYLRAISFISISPPAWEFVSWELCSSFNLSHGEAMKLTLADQGKVRCIFTLPF